MQSISAARSMPSLRRVLSDPLRYRPASSSKRIALTRRNCAATSLTCAMRSKRISQAITRGIRARSSSGAIAFPACSRSRTCFVSARTASS